MSSGGQQPVTQQTTQTKDPWSQAQPALGQALNSALTLYNQDTGYQPYSGVTRAPDQAYIGLATTPWADTLYQQTLNRGPAGVLAGINQGTSLINSGGLSPELRTLYQQAQGDENPYLQNIINTSNRQISDKIGSSMSGAGRYGSGQHTDVAARAMAEAADPLLAQDYARRQQQQQSILEGGLQRAGQWSQLMPSLEEARWAPTQSLMALGEYYTGKQQQDINDQIKQYNLSQSRPWEQIARLNAIAGQAGGLGGSQFTSSPIQQPSTLQKLLGGGLAGAGIGASFGGPAGAGVGALGGGLLGLL